MFKRPKATQEQNGIHELRPCVWAWGCHAANRDDLGADGK